MSWVVAAGTGLGLSQVYAMAAQAGGTARVEPGELPGTTVVTWLPSAQAAAQAEPVAADPAPTVAYRASKVLVVDDDPDVRLFLSASLETLGFAVAVAEDAERGLSLLDGADPDLLLVDFAMPGMNGAQMAEVVRARRPTLPIIFADPAAVERALGQSAVLLKKPFGVADLELVVRTALASVMELDKATR